MGSSPFTELISELNNRYNEILQIHTNNTDNRVFNFTVIVCGYNGNKFVAMQYSFTTDYINIPMGVHLIETNPDTGIRCFMIGTDKYLLRHNNNYNDELRKNQLSTILQYKNIMQNVFDMGVKFDGTINNINIYEKIRKKDIL